MQVTMYSIEKGKEYFPFYSRTLVHSGIRATIFTSFLFFPIMPLRSLSVDSTAEGGWFLSMISRQFSALDASNLLKA